MELFETLDYREKKETIMALEKFFNCSTTIARLRSAPLGKLVDNFCLWLQKLEYHRYTILRHWRMYCVLMTIWVIHIMILKIV